MSQFQKFIYFLFAFAALIYAISFEFSQYVEVKKHNLDVISAMRICMEADENKLVRFDCAEAVKKEYIFDYKRPLGNPSSGVFYNPFIEDYTK